MPAPHGACSSYLWLVYKAVRGIFQNQVEGSASHVLDLLDNRLQAEGVLTTQVPEHLEADG